MAYSMTGSLLTILLLILRRLGKGRGKREEKKALRVSVSRVLGPGTSAISVSIIKSFRSQKFAVAHVLVAVISLGHSTSRYGPSHE